MNDADAGRREILRYYDPKSGQLLYFGQHPDSNFWDEHWRDTAARAQIVDVVAQSFVTLNTLRFLPKPTRPVLEGGCGMSMNVKDLEGRGVASVGLDFAPEALHRAKTLCPNLKLVQGDLWRLPFLDGSLSGYWSLGVIEHFREGCGGILHEMNRVLESRGVLFLTFPFMSRMRKVKAFFRCYSRVPNAPKAPFYQFALNPDRVKKLLAAEGFQLVEQKGFDSFKGIKDEVPLIGAWLARQIQRQVNSRIMKRIFEKVRFALDAWAGHCVLQVYIKSDGAGS